MDGDSTHTLYLKQPFHKQPDFAATDTIREYLGDDTTTVTFINTPESKPGGYELPKTGGEGSMPYAIGGIAAMSLGLGGPLLIGRKRKHEDDRGGAGK